MAQDFLIEPRRTILYYPTISIPDGRWLRQALLYFDKVASIVPSDVNWGTGGVERALVPLTPDIELLQGEGAFRRVPPEFLFLHQDEAYWERGHTLSGEFKEAINSEPFNRLLDANRHRQMFVKLHHDKMSDSCVEYLSEKNLIRFDEQHPRHGGDWFLVEENTALLYMSLLAQALADVDRELTVTGTDQPEYERLVFHATSLHNGFACLDTRFKNVLPIPRDDASFTDILRFKRRRREELLHFRQQIDALQLQLSTTTEREEIRGILERFSNALEGGVNNLTRQLDEANIPIIILGSIKCLMNAPTAWVTALLLASPLVGVHVATAPLALPALGVAGTVEVGYHLITQRNQRRAILRASPFAYLYHAHTEGLLWS